MKKIRETLLTACLLFLSTAASGAVIIQYHHVSNDTPASTSISPELFRQQMTYLHDNGFHVIPLTELVQQLKQKKILPDKTLAITFDDAYLSIYEQALPVMQKFRFPFTVFINTELVGSAPFMTWKQLIELKENNATIANHAANHTHLIRRLKNESDSQWRERIKSLLVNAENTLKAKLGAAEKMLAYPYGEYDNKLKQLVKELGYTGFSQLSGAFDDNVDWQAIPRFSFGGIYTKMESFIEKVNSLPMPALNATAFDENGHQLADPLIPDWSRKPVLKLSLKNKIIASRVRCFATGQGSIETIKSGNQVEVKPEKEIPVGRSRFNCTAESGQPNRYYWYSHFFIRKNPDGSWYAEQ